MSILNDLLDFSKIEAGKMLVESVEFDLRTCAEEVTEIMAARAGSKGIELNALIPPDLPDLITGDGGRVRQILTNLIGNAVKFTEHGEVRVVVEVLEQSRGKMKVRMAVHDTGIGIAPDRVGRIFESFTQADGSMSRRYGGTGLGLTLTKQLAELMGGHLGVTSVEGEGSCFWVDLPFGKVASLGLPAGVQEFKGRIAAVADRNATTRKVLIDHLSYWGCSVVECADAEDVLSVLEFSPGRKRLDVVFLEAAMEVSSEVLGAAGVPVVSLLPISANTGGSEGTHAVLGKPIRQRQLKAMLGKHAQPIEAPRKAPAQDAAPAPLGLTVLIAEDNDVNMLILQRYLSKLGCDYQSVENGAAVMSALNAGDFDLVLMDVQMPVMDGFEATKMVREAEQFTGRHIPIIALTAHAQVGDRERCLKAGMDDYLSKPVLRGDLEAKLKLWGGADELATAA
jgi:CheY-like chemotaxis protein